MLSVNKTHAVFIDDHPMLDRNLQSTEELIKLYFERCYTNIEITNALALGHAIIISTRTVKRILKRLNLKRRTPIMSPLEDVVAVILKEIEGSGSCLGYRTMWKRLKTQYRLKVTRDTIMQALRVIDPNGVDRRKRRRLQRRKYRCPGPNYIWHIDGYDKLKPYGFSIHGCIDGFSRRILWLEVGPTNNNPNVIASYYLRCLHRLGVVPRIIRADLGNENSVVRFLQPYFRFNDDGKFSGRKSFMYGKSTSNQRIEAYWSKLRIQYTDWWINFFKDLRDSGTYDDSDPLHLDCLRFCFTRLLRKGINNIATEWNQHRIQVKKNQEIPSGIPDVLYFFPESVHVLNYGKSVHTEDIVACSEMYTNNLPNLYGCSDRFIQIIDLMKPDCQEPQTADDALLLFNELIDRLERI